MDKEIRSHCSAVKTQRDEEPVWTTERIEVKQVVPGVSPENKLAKRILGLIYAAISGVSVAASSVIRKNLSSLPPSQLVIHRYLGVTLYGLAAMMYYRQTPMTTKKSTIVLSFRGFCLGGAYTLAFVSLNYIPLAEFSVLSGSSPVFGTLMARVFLKEQCGFIDILCLILSTLGVILVSRLPVIVMTRTLPYDLSYYKGIALTLLLAAMLAFGAVTIRVKEVKHHHYSVILFFLGAFAIVECVMVSAVYGYTQLLCGSGNWYVILLSIAGIGIDLAGTVALKYLLTGISMMVYSSSNIIGSYVWQIAVDRIEPDAYTISGTVVIMLCILLLTLKQTVPKMNSKIFPRSQH